MRPRITRSLSMGAAIRAESRTTRSVISMLINHAPLVYVSVVCGRFQQPLFQFTYSNSLLWIIIWSEVAKTAHHRAMRADDARNQVGRQAVTPCAAVPLSKERRGGGWRTLSESSLPLLALQLPKVRKGYRLPHPVAIVRQTA